MDDLREQIEALEKSANLSTSISHVQETIDLLVAARAKIAAGEHPCRVLGGSSSNHHRPEPQTAPMTLAKLNTPLKQGLDTALKDIKPIYSGLNKYGKALDKVLLPGVRHSNPAN